MVLNDAKRESLRHGLAAIAEQMGEVLTRAGFSPNIKERRDHSCALFTPDAELVAQAEHIPVHLGSMPRAVRGILDAVDGLGPGQMALSNDPAHGGTHLPDLTLVAPVDREGTRLGYVAARAHHADVGGTAPASMPADATRLDDEGLVLEPVVAVEDGAWVDEVRDRVLDATRTPRERAGDLAAQRGALDVGARGLEALAARRAQDLDAGMAAILEHTERLTRARLEERPDGENAATALLETREGEATLAARTRIEGGRLLVDYEGTDPAIEGNLNAPRPVTEAGITYVLRLLLGADIPSNAGLTRPVNVRVPEGSILDPPRGAAVAGGNVETSQRNVDLLIDALAEAFPDRAPAQSQGTMNNVALGGEAFAYYETLGGGEGATPRRAGASGVHTHMTNTQNTPIETLEHDLPLRARALTLRRETGGTGQHAGGDGLRRELEVLEPTRANLITTRRRTRPSGREGGEDAQPGRNSLAHEEGSVEELGPIASVDLEPGDRLVIETPGGGGWGEAGAE